jgi:hypothetical protein
MPPFAAPRVFAALVPVALLATSCLARTEGDLRMDKQKLDLTECRSGEIYGFVGVEFVSSNGAKVRVATSPSGAGQVFAFAPGAMNGTDLGMCAKLVVERQSSKVDKVTNVKGRVTIDCNAKNREVLGDVAFENCH